MDKNVYFQLKGHWENYNSVFVHISWDQYDFYDPKCTGTINIRVVDDFGRIHKEIKGGNMNIHDNGSLVDHIPDVLEFLGFVANEKYEILTETEFPIEFK